MVVTAGVGWVAFSYEPSKPSEAKVDGASVRLGLPGFIKNADDHELSAKSAILLNTTDDSIAFEHNGFDRRPIASITKLMTAMVAIDHKINLEQEGDILPNEYVIGGQFILHPGEKATMRDLLAASLVGSANNATLAYVRQLGIPEEEFVREMNRKAITLGLEQTEFFDVTGLNPKNTSTAYEVAKLAKEAFTNYPIIADLTAQTGYDFVAIGSGREHTIKNTNKLISEWGITSTGSKTGFLYEAEYCLVMRGGEGKENSIAVVLGSPTEYDHFADTQKLLTLSFAQ